MVNQPLSIETGFRSAIDIRSIGLDRALTPSSISTLLSSKSRQDPSFRRQL